MAQPKKTDEDLISERLEKLRLTKNIKAVIEAPKTLEKDETNSDNKIFEELLIETNNFLKLINEFRESSAFLHSNLSDNHNTFQENRNNFLTSLPSTQVLKRQKKDFYFLTPEEHKEFTLINKGVTLTRSSLNIIPNSFLIFLISQYEFFFAKLLKLFYKRFNIKLDKTTEVSLEKLESRNSIEEIKEHLLESEIDSIMHKSTSEQLKRLEKLLNLDNDTFKKDLSREELIELNERRNIIVHSNSLVSDIFIRRFKEEGISCKYKKGESLATNGKYLINACDLIYETVIKLIYHIRYKCYNEEANLTSLYEELNQKIFDLLQINRALLAQKIGDFIISTFKKVKNNIPSESTRLYITINYAISFKMRNQIKECKAILNKIDRSAKGHLFQFANYILQEERQKAADIMPIVCNKTKKTLITDQELKERPLFFEFKKRDEFLEAYKKIFKKRFVLEDKILKNK